MRELTARQQQILGLLREHIAATGFPPTRVEIAAALGFRSANAAEDHLRALARKGVIELTSGASRGIRLLKMPDEQGQSVREVAISFAVPLVGRVAAGSPILAQEHVDNHYALDPSLFPTRPDYLLRVRGMSMRDAGILDGDLLAVKRSADARNGQIVVARLADEVTVKRWRRSGPIVELQAENPDFEPIVVDTRREELSVEGIGVGLIRNAGNL